MPFLRRDRSVPPMTSPPPTVSAPARESLILVGDTSADVMVLARLLARATDGTVLQTSDPVEEAIRRRHLGLVVVRSAPARATRKKLDALVRDAPCPVAVAPVGYAGRAPAALRRIGVAFDGWEESRVALAEAAVLAEGGVADVQVLMVADPHTAASAQAGAGDDEWLLGHGALADRYLQGVTENLASRIRAQHSVLQGQVAPALVSAARSQHLDLLVLGSRRLGAIARVALGSVSHALLADPPCALLVCPRGVAAPRETASLAGVARRVV